MRRKGRRTSGGANQWPLRALLAALLVTAATPLETTAHAAERTPTPLWVATQLAPSPEIAWGRGATTDGLSWQVTPLLYSFGVNQRVSPWRVLVVDPFARQSGSLELHLDPELLFFDRPQLAPRAGLRAYFPLVERGEALSASIGVAYRRLLDTDQALVEGGAYILWGILGARVSYAPRRDTPAQTTLSLTVRYF